LLHFLPWLPLGQSLFEAQVWVQACVPSPNAKQRFDVHCVLSVQHAAKGRSLPVRLQPLPPAAPAVPPDEVPAAPPLAPAAPPDEAPAVPPVAPAEPPVALVPPVAPALPPLPPEAPALPPVAVVPPVLLPPESSSDPQAAVEARAIPMRTKVEPRMRTFIALSIADVDDGGQRGTPQTAATVGEGPRPRSVIHQ